MYKRSATHLARQQYPQNHAYSECASLYLTIYAYFMCNAVASIATTNSRHLMLSSYTYNFIIIIFRYTYVRTMHCIYLHYT